MVPAFWVQWSAHSFRMPKQVSLSASDRERRAVGIGCRRSKEELQTMMSTMSAAAAFLQRRTRSTETATAATRKTMERWCNMISARRLRAAGCCWTRRCHGSRRDQWLRSSWTGHRSNNYVFYLFYEVVRTCRQLGSFSKRPIMLSGSPDHMHC